MRRFVHAGRAGFTLLEIVVSTTLLMILAGSLITALDALKGVTTAGSVGSKLQQAGERAMMQIVGDMQRSGFVDFDFGGAQPQPFPFLFDGGDASVEWSGFPPVMAMDLHTHVGATKKAQAGEAGFGLDREVVFLLPADFDADGIPDIDANGQLVWDPQQVSYTLITRPGGINYLERRVGGFNPTKVAMFVERIAFDDTASTTLPGVTAVPVRAIRIQLFLRQTDAKGQVHRFTARATVRMRNSPGE